MSIAVTFRVYLTLIIGAGLLLAQNVSAALPTFDGTSARIQLLDARTVDAPAESGAATSVRLVYLVTRQPGVAGKLALREPQDIMIRGRSYREITQAALGRVFEPSTTVTDAAPYFQKHPALKTADAPDRGALVIQVELPGARFPKDADLQSTLFLGFGEKVEKSTYHFRLIVD